MLWLNTSATDSKKACTVGSTCFAPLPREAGSVSFSAKRGLRIHVIFPHVNGEKTCYTHLDLCKSSHAVPMQYELVKILRTLPYTLLPCESL